ncbi:glycosyl transferase [Sporodiniella umbellata]|nr:glycosyl transferase [Sporodiniella umbellata]
MVNFIEYLPKRRMTKLLWVVLFYALLMLSLFMLRPTLLTDLGYFTRPLWDKNPQTFDIIPHYYAENVPEETLCKLHGWSLKKENKVKIYDAIIFSVELDLLEIRIREMWEVVDKFVILESNATFMGQTKPLTFKENKDRFKFAESKIHHVTLSQQPLPPNEGPFFNENMMRQAMDKVLLEAGVQQDDWVLMSDVDEIIRGQTLQVLKMCDGTPDTLHFQLRNYLYSFEFYLDSESWRAHIVKYRRGETYYSHGQITRNLLADSGWHCSFCFRAISDFQFKMISYSHSDRVRYPELLESSRIQDTICEGNDIFDMLPESYTYRDLISKMGSMKSSKSAVGLPVAVLNDSEKYKFLLPGGCKREES